MKAIQDAQRYPRRPEQFRMRCDRLIQHAREPHPIMFRIPPMIMLECKMLMESYYGGRWRFAWRLLYEAAYLTFRDIIACVRIKICDWMGWTKLYYYPETERMLGHWQRHGRKCSGSPNCANMNCIEEGVPKWFRWITRWDY